VQLDAPSAAQPRIGDNNLALSTDQLQFVATGEIQRNVELANDIGRQRKRRGQAQVATLRTGAGSSTWTARTWSGWPPNSRIALMQ
jgi:hypothetical protein